LNSKGWRTNVIIFKLHYSRADVPTRKEEELLIGLLKDLRSDVVGLSVKTPFLRIARRLSEKIRDEVGSLVAWGGSHPTILPEESIRIADVVCIGEGEHPLAELIEKIATGKVVDDIPNLWIRRHGEIRRNDQRPLLQGDELDRLPFPDIGGEGKFSVHRGKLLPGDPLEKAMEYYPMASRGCPFRCSYCINGILKERLHAKGAFVRLRSPKRWSTRLSGFWRDSPR